METKITVNKNEEKIVPFMWIDGEETDVTYSVDLVEEGSSVHIVGLFLGTKHNKITFNTDVTHTGIKTFSRTTLRGVFLNNASISNDGMVRISKGAKGADGYFASKILLFDNAKGRSVPSLEIDENELKAGHASTIGRPDAEQLFYMQSRGMSEKEAQKLIITGFFEPVIKLMTEKEQQDVRKRLDKYLK
ncbi:hypothetical protein BH11PAT1_BH11PAT1_4520 [soil metagenome]